MLPFDWDDANRDHVELHKVSTAEAEHAVSGLVLELDAYTIAGEDRTEQVGRTANGRILQTVTIVRRGRVRVVTAYDAPKALRRDFLLFERSYYG